MNESDFKRGVIVGIFIGMFLGSSIGSITMVEIIRRAGRLAPPSPETVLSPQPADHSPLNHE